MRLKACLNGTRHPEEHPALPVTPAQLATAARACVQAGVFALHLHPRDGLGRESLAAGDVAAALNAVRAACPGIPVGISGGYWILPDVDGQLAAAQAWHVKPDFVSVNWHEPHAVALAGELLRLGMGVEAGLCTRASAQAFLTWALRDRVIRVLVELLGDADTLDEAHAMLGALDDVSAPRLLHGAGPGCSPLLREAARLGLDSRVGLEDTLTLPDGRVAADNPELVRTAFDLAARS